MAGERTLVINIIGDSASAQKAFAKTGAAADAASAQVGRAGKAVESTGSKMESAGKKMSSVGGTLTKYVSLPLVGIGAAAVKMSLDWQKSMLLVETHTETSRKMVERYKQEILEMSSSGKFTQGPNEFAEAMYHIASDGYKGTKALHALRESANLAMLGQSGLAETTYAVVSAMKTGIKGTQDLHETIGVLNGTMGAGDTKMGELTSALSTGVVPAARSAGLELRDVGAALAFLTARGIPAQKAAYGLSMNFQQLLPNTEKSVGAFESLGLGFDELAKKAEHGPDGWLKALEDLQEHLEGVDKYSRTQDIHDIFGGGRTSRGVLAQLQNLDDLRATYERLGVIAGRTDKNLGIARESEANQWKEEWAQLQTALVELGNDLTPVLLPLLKTVSHDVGDIAQDFEKLPKPVQKWGIELGIAAVALGPIVKGLGGILMLAGKVTKAFEGMGAAEAAAGAEGAIGGAAGGVAGSAGVGAAGGAAARWLGTDEAPVAAGAWSGAAGEGAAVGGAGILGMVPGSGALATGLTGLAGVAGGYFAAEFGAHVIEGLTGADLLENQNLRTSLTHGFNTSHVAQTEQVNLAEIAAGEKGLHPRLGPHTLETKDLEKSWRETMTRLAGDTSVGMKVIGADLGVGLEETDQVWSTGTKPWRAHTAAAMEGAVDAIRTGMQDGTINAEKGQKEINHLLERIHLVKGDDPFGLAQATAKSFEQANSITSSGVKQWAAKLAEMPSAARKSSIDSTNQMLEAWAQGHPKIEHQIESLTRFEVTHFGATNKQLREGVLKGATGPIAEAFQEAASGVGGALNNIGTNTSDLIKALGLHDVVEFQALVLGPSRLGSTTGPRGGEAKHHEAPGSYHGKGTQSRAGGGSVRVPGIGLQDSVPLSVNGAMSAVVAPGEDLVVFNRHQRPMVDQALANEYGVAGLPGFFNTFDREHWKAGGGSVKVSGPGAIANIGHGALAKAVQGANEYIARHQPHPSSTTGAGASFSGPTPAGVGTFQGFPVDKWIIPELIYAVQHGWTGHITSGYRTPQHSAELGFPGDEHTKTSYPDGAVDFGGMDDPAGAANRAAFIAATKGYRGPHLLLPEGFHDDGHMSGTGHARGGFAGGATESRVGLPPGLHLHGPPMFKREGPAQYDRAYELFSPWATGAPYQTKLSPKQESAFKTFVEGHPNLGARYHPYTSKTDYDLRGWWLNERGNVAHANGETYLSDTYKTPYSVGFSKWSEYAKQGTPYDWVDEQVGEGVLANLRTGQIILDHRFAPNARGEYTHARGGIVGSRRGGPPKWEPEYLRKLGKVWNRAAHLYGHSAGQPMPPAIIDPGLRSLDADGLTMPAPAKKPGPYGKTVAFSLADAEGFMRGVPYAEEVPLHEWTHVFQKPGLTHWEAEGGATDFERWAGPQVYPGIGTVPWPPGYHGFAERVLGQRGQGWVERGQFGGNYASGGMVVKGKISYEGGTGHGTADGVHTDEDPGFAIRDDSTLGDWFWATAGGHSGLLQHTDWGPAAWTGRDIDFTAAGLKKIGSSLSITDTDGSVEWMGHSVAEAVKNMGGRKGGAAGSKSSKSKEPKFKAGHTGTGGGTYGSPAGPVKPSKSTPSTLPPLGPSAIPGSAKGLPPGLQHQLAQPGLTDADRYVISERGIEDAEKTRDPFDNEPAIKFQEALLHKREKAIQEKIAHINQQLKQSLTKKQRQALISQRSTLITELGSTQTSLAGDKEKLQEFRKDPLGMDDFELPGEGEDPAVKAAEEAKEAAEEMTAAVKALKESIDQQNAIATSEQAIDLAEAKKAFTDIVAGQLGPTVYRGSLAAGAGNIGSAANS